MVPAYLSDGTVDATPWVVAILPCTPETLNMRNSTLFPVPPPLYGPGVPVPPVPSVRRFISDRAAISQRSPVVTRDGWYFIAGGFLMAACTALTLSTLFTG